MTNATNFENFKTELLARIGELMTEARKGKHPLAKFLCVLLTRALSAPGAKRFTFAESLERNSKAVLLDQARSNADLDYPLHQVRSWIQYYLERCADFTIWEKASIAVCDCLVMYHEKKMLHTTMVKSLFTVMTAKAKNETRENKAHVGRIMKKKKKQL